MSVEVKRSIDHSTMLGLYRKVLLVREFEEKVFDLFGKNLVPGTLHLYTGQEGVSAGVCQALRQEDLVQSTHRGHGHCLAKGADPKTMMAELFGKATGLCRGKGGSMHITDFSKGIIGATGVVGSGMPIAAGAGLSAKMRSSGQVVACFFGDGASNNGSFHESMNIASLWKLPVIFVCENNFYAMGTRISKAMVMENISDRGQAYSIPAATVMGNDAEEVYNTAAKAVKLAREGEGPFLLECKTYRHRGHSRFDPGKYRPAAEVKHWLGLDPVAIIREKAISCGAVDAEGADRIAAEIKAEIEEAASFAAASPDPDPKTVTEDVYKE